MRIKKNITLGIINWSNTKFSEPTLWDCMVDSKEYHKFYLGVKGLVSISSRATKTWPRLLSRKFARGTISLKTRHNSLRCVLFKLLEPILSRSPRSHVILFVSLFPVFCSNISVVILLTDQIIFLSFSFEIFVFNHVVSHGWYFLYSHNFST